MTSTTPKDIALTAILAAVAASCHVCHGEKAPEAVVKERFWAHAPKPGLQDHFRWSFEEKAAPTDEAIGRDFGDILDPESARPDTGAFAGVGKALGSAEKIAYELRGDAEVTEAGRFGGGVRVGLKGWIASETVPFEKWRRAGLVTIDFWVRPDADLPDDPCPVFVFPSAVPKVPPVKIVRQSGGGIALFVGDTVLVEHPRLVRPGAWRHLALDLGTKEATLYVDGEPAAFPQAGSAPKAAQMKALALYHRYPGTAFTFGGGPGETRGFSGLIDEVRAKRGPSNLYVLDEPNAADPDAKRVLADQPPFFRKPLTPLLYCPFDGELTPAQPADVEARGEVLNAARAFVPGFRGQALAVSGAAFKGAVKFDGKGLLPLGSGTVCFWFQPLNWNNFLVSEMGQGQSLIQFRRGKAAAGIGAKKHRGPMAARSPFVEFAPGRWVHVTVCWRNYGVAGVYLNGKPQPLPQINAGLPKPPAAKEKGAPPPTWEDIVRLAGGALYDELCMYSHTFTAAEAWNAYARYLPDAEAQCAALPELDLRFSYTAHDWNPDGRLSLTLSARALEKGIPASVDLTFLKQDSGETLTAVEGLKLDGNLMASHTVWRDFAFGDHPIIAILRDGDGQAIKEVKTTYTRARPPWYDNELGKDRYVPWPWTPIEVAGDELSVWGRTLQVGAAGLPARLTSADETVWRGPVRIHGTAAGAEIGFKSGGLAFNETAEDRCEWSGTLSSDAVSAKVSAWMEYDGLVYYTVTLRPPEGKAVTLDKLMVDFPFAKPTATQLISNGGGQNFRASWQSTWIPKGEGRVWDSASVRYQKSGNPGSFLPIVWIGNDHCGVCFHAENEKGWRHDPKNVPAQEVIRDGETVTYRLNVIAQPIEVKDSRTFTFIIHPTPTKPMPESWRGWGRAPRGTPRSVIDAIDIFTGFGLTAKAGVISTITFKMEPTSWEDAEWHAKKGQAQWGKNNPRIMYMDYSWPRPGPSLMNEWKALWAGTGRICWGLDAVEDYFVWIIQEYIRRDLIEGLYIDDTSMGRTFSLEATAFINDDGKRCVGFNTMGFRRFLQRTWKILLEHKKRPHIMPHMTFCFEIPALSFTSACVNGEARDIYPIMGRDSVDTWSRRELRIMANAPKWGFATFWKPPVQVQPPGALMVKPKPAEDVWKYWQTRTMHGLLCQHDIWYCWLQPGHLWNTFVEFGLGHPELTFVPYWENAEEVTTVEIAEKAEADGDGGDGTHAAEVKRIENPKDVLVGFFVRPDRALMMVTNLSRQERLFELTLAPSEIFRRPVKAIEMDEFDDGFRDPLSARTFKEAHKAALQAAKPDVKVVVPGEEEPEDDEFEKVLTGTGEGGPADPWSKYAPEFSTNRVLLRVRPRDFRLIRLVPKE